MKFLIISLAGIGDTLLASYNDSSSVAQVPMPGSRHGAHTPRTRAGARLHGGLQRAGPVWIG